MVQIFRVALLSLAPLSNSVQHFIITLCHKSVPFHLHIYAANFFQPTAMLFVEVVVNFLLSSNWSPVDSAGQLRPSTRRTPSACHLCPPARNHNRTPYSDPIHSKWIARSIKKSFHWPQNSKSFNFLQIPLKSSPISLNFI